MLKKLLSCIPSARRMPIEMDDEHTIEGPRAPIPTHPFEQVQPVLESKGFIIDANLYMRIIAILDEYLSKATPTSATKIDGKAHGIPYSIMLLYGHLFITRVKTDIPSHPKCQYQIAVDLSTIKPYFIKHYTVPVNEDEQPLEAEDVLKIKLLTREVNNMNHWDVKCLYVPMKNGNHYVLSPYIEGDDYFECMHNKKYDNRELIILFRMICQYVQRLHTDGWYHLDVKPENFMVQKNGDQFHIEPIDFATFTRLEDAKTMRSVYGSELYKNKNWVKAFYNKKAEYSIWNDTYALNIMLQQYCHKAKKSTHHHFIEAEHRRISYFELLPIDQCYPISQLILLTHDIEYIVSQKPSATRASTFTN